MGRGSLAEVVQGPTGSCSDRRAVEYSNPTRRPIAFESWLIGRKSEELTEADRIARNMAREADAARRERERQEVIEKQRERDRLAAELRALIPEVLNLLAERGYPGLKPVVVRTHRFPPLGDLFGDRTLTKGGWEIPGCGWLLSDGRWSWQGRIAPLSHPWLVSHHDSMCSGLRDLKRELLERPPTEH
jgi:hypothetical protein